MKAYAWQGEELRHSSTFVALLDDDVVGFATVTASALYPSQVNTDQFLPHQPLPILLIRGIGVQTELQRRGIGGRLMLTVLEQVPHMAAMPGCLGVFLDARPQSVDFYGSLGFVPMEAKGGEFLPMFMERGLIEALLALP